MQVQARGSKHCEPSAIYLMALTLRVGSTRRSPTQRQNWSPLMGPRACHNPTCGCTSEPA